MSDESWGAKMARQEVLSLLHQVGHKINQKLPCGANQEQIDAFGKRMNMEVPRELREWLSVCNAPLIAQGIYGIPPTRKPLCIEYNLKPEYVALGWLPIAGDGCGDDYVLDTTCTVGSTHPIYFVDHECGYDTAQYVVASGLWAFLRFLLQEELDEEYWPFDKEQVLARDPALREYQGKVPLAWEAEE